MAIHTNSPDSPERMLAKEREQVAQLVKSIKDEQRIAIMGNLILGHLKSIPQQPFATPYNPCLTFSDSLPESRLEITRAINECYGILEASSPMSHFLALQQQVNFLYVNEEEFTWIESDQSACMFVYVSIKNIGNGFLNEIYQNLAYINQQSNISYNSLTTYQFLNLPAYINSHTDRIGVIKKYFSKQVNQNPNFNYKHRLIASLHEQWNNRFRKLVKPRSWEEKGVAGIYGKAIDFILRQPAKKIPLPFFTPLNQVVETTIGDLGLGIQASTEEESKLNYYGLLWAIYGRAPGVSMLDIHKACDKYCTQLVSRELDAKHPQRLTERRERVAQRRLDQEHAPSSMTKKTGDGSF